MFCSLQRQKADWCKVWQSFNSKATTGLLQLPRNIPTQTPKSNYLKCINWKKYCEPIFCKLYFSDLQVKLMIGFYDRRVFWNIEKEFFMKNNNSKVLTNLYRPNWVWLWGAGCLGHGSVVVYEEVRAVSAFSDVAPGQGVSGHWRTAQAVTKLVRLSWTRTLSLLLNLLHLLCLNLLHFLLYTLNL